MLTILSTKESPDINKLDDSAAMEEMAEQELELNE